MPENYIKTESQTQKYKYHMMALMCGLKLLIYFLKQGFIM